MPTDISVTLIFLDMPYALTNSSPRFVMTFRGLYSHVHSPPGRDLSKTFCSFLGFLDPPFRVADSVASAGNKRPSVHPLLSMRPPIEGLLPEQSRIVNYIRHAEVLGDRPIA